MSTPSIFKPAHLFDSLLKPFSLSPDPESIGNTITKYGPPALMLGVGYSGLKNLIAQIAQQKAEAKAQEQAAGTDTGTLVIGIPAKQAEAKQGTDQVAWWLPTLLASGMGGFALGNYGTDAIFKAMRVADLNRRLEASKREYAKILTQQEDRPTVDVAAASPETEKKVGEYPVIDSLIDVAIGHEKEAIFGIGAEHGRNPAYIFGGIPLSIFLLSSLVGHKLMYDRKRQMEELYASKEKMTPRQIKLVTIPSPSTQQEPKLLASTDDKDVPQEPDTAQERFPRETQPAVKVAQSWLMSPVRNIAFGSLAMNIAEKASPEAAIRAEEEKKKKLEAQGIIPGESKGTTVVEEDGKIKVVTPSGKVIITSEDPNAAQWLKEHSREVEMALVDTYSDPSSSRTGPGAV